MLDLIMCPLDSRWHTWGTDFLIIVIPNHYNSKHVTIQHVERSGIPKICGKVDECFM